MKLLEPRGSWQHIPIINYALLPLLSGCGRLFTDRTADSQSHPLEWERPVRENSDRPTVSQGGTVKLLFVRLQACQRVGRAWMALLALSSCVGLTQAVPAASGALPLTRPTVSRQVALVSGSNSGIDYAEYFRRIHVRTKLTTPGGIPTYTIVVTNSIAADFQVVLSEPKTGCNSLNTMAGGALLTPRVTTIVATGSTAAEAKFRGAEKYAALEPALLKRLKLATMKFALANINQANAEACNGQSRRNSGTPIIGVSTFSIIKAPHTALLRVKVQATSNVAVAATSSGTASVLGLRAILAAKGCPAGSVCFQGEGFAPIAGKSRIIIRVTTTTGATTSVVRVLSAN